MLIWRAVRGVYTDHALQEFLVLSLKVHLLYKRGHFESGDIKVKYYNLNDIRNCQIMACAAGNCGPGYASPKEAFAKGAREKLLYIPCIIPGKNRPDYLSTVDVDPESPTCGQIISRLYLPFIADEVHHTGWNACSSCYDDPSRSRNLLVMPGKSI